MFTKIAPKRFLFSVFLDCYLHWTNAYESKEADQLFADIQNQILDSLGWLIILLTNGFLVFVIYLAFSKHKALILGGPDAKPEFSRVNWIAMLFSAGLWCWIIVLWCS
jgi:choline/glycine/proline betaine transport protein